MNPLTQTDGGIILFPISDAAPDAYSILVWLNTLAVTFGRDPDVRAFTESILPPLFDNDIEGQLRAVTNYVKTNVKYLSDPEGTEYVISPLVLMQRIEKQGYAYGDCDDHCLLHAAMVRSLGIDERIIGVKQGPTSTYFDHVIVQAPLDGQLIDIDLCSKMAPQPNYQEKLVAQL